MNTRTLALQRSILAGMASVFAITAHAQDQADHVASGDLNIYYEVHGDLIADATPFLVLHGGMGSIQGDFGDLLPILAAQAPVIGIEQQGHGHTGGREASVSLSSMRADTLAVLDVLEVDRVHVVGFSMGGMLAVELGVAAQDRIATLTAISVSQNLDGMHPAIGQMNRNPDSPPLPEALELIPTEKDFARMQAVFADNPDGPDQFRRTFGQLQSFMVSGWGWSDDELASIKAPTLIVLGDTDFMSVNHAARMAGLFGGQLAVLPGTTHLSIMRRADWIAPLIANRIATADE